MPAKRHRDLTGRFVRRVGLARTTTIAVAVGLSLAAVGGARPMVALIGLILALLGALGGLLMSRLVSADADRASLVVVASVVLVGLFGGYLGGSARVMALLDSSLQRRVGSTITAELVITGQVRSSGGWQSAAAVVRGPGGLFPGSGGISASAAAAKGETVLLEIAPTEGPPGVTLRQGLIVAVEGTIQAPEGPSASGFDQAAYLRHQGIRVVLSADGSDISILGRRGGISGWFDRLRSSARAHLSRGPDARLDEVLKGVVLGETGGIDKGWLEAFRRSGTAHMLSVSGLHVASIAAIMIGLARLVRASRGVGFLLAAAAAILMIPFVGASPPLVRAAVMIVVVLAGSWAGRRRDHWQVLALAAVVVLALNPFAVSDVGFQLSFAALAGMLALVGPLHRSLKRLPSAIGSNLAVSIAASLGTAPVSLLVFDRTSLIAPLANLLVVPVLPVITGLGMAGVFLGFLWTGFSTALDTLAALPMTWAVQVSRLLAFAPVLDVRDLGRALLAAGVGVAAVPAGLALTGRAVGTPFNVPVPLFKRSIGWLRARRPKSRRWAVVLGVAVVFGGLALGGVAYSPLVLGLETVATLAPGKGWPDQVEVRVLDVGQGSAVLVRTPGHRALLFDGGPAGCDLARQLHTLGVRKLDLVVISHPHADHFAGLLEAVDGLKIGTFVDQTAVVSGGPPGGSSAPGTVQGPAARTTNGAREAADYLELRRRIAIRGGRHVQAGTGSLIDVDGVAIRFFAPSRPVTLVDGPDPWQDRSGPPTGDELNDSSLVAVLSAGSIEVLIPGDAEAEVLQAYKLPPIDIIVVPHHGSRGAVSGRLLEELEVKAACISVGGGNSFGHPDPSTMSMLQAAVASVLRTDEAGWVSCTVNGDRVVLATERKPGQ
ncbi:MAG: ComEC/Rec2 family competence protein [bacterium]